MPALWRFQRGMTLLELLIVLVIIGIVFTGAVMFVPHAVDPEEQALIQLGQRLQFARDKAILESRPYGLRITNAGYAFERLDGTGQWHAVAHQKILAEKQWPKNTKVELHVDAGSAPAPTGTTVRPQVYLDADGLSQAFVLRLQSGADAPRRLHWTRQGGFRVE